MQKMSGSGCVGGSCLGTHLQADFAPISENEAKTRTRDRARRARTGARGYQVEFSSYGFLGAKPTQMEIRSSGSTTRKDRRLFTDIADYLLTSSNAGINVLARDQHSGSFVCILEKSLFRLRTILGNRGIFYIFHPIPNPHDPHDSYRATRNIADSPAFSVELV